MKLPRFIKVTRLSNVLQTLKLLTNHYGAKSASRIWIKHLFKGLGNKGFKLPLIDECVWFRGKIIFAFYVDNEII